MKIECAWCKRDMGEKEGGTDDQVTHGICPECQEKHFPGVVIPT